MSEERSEHGHIERIDRALFDLRHDQKWSVDRIMALSANIIEMSIALRDLLAFVAGTPNQGHTSIQVTAVELKPQEIPMPPIDHMQDLQLPSSTVRAKLSVVNPRKADGSRVTSVTWSSSDESQVSLQAIPDSNVQVADPAWVDPGDGTTAPLIDEIDPVDGQANQVFATYANTPLDAGSATITVRASGMADCDVKVTYSDPPLGHFAITAVQAAEE